MVLLHDGRRLMANKAEIMAFMEKHHIVGSTIVGIYPQEMDYGIGNWDELMEEWGGFPPGDSPCSITTDGSIFLEMDNGEWLEIEFSGDGPVILNMVPKGRPYPEIPDHLFALNTVFHQCRGKQIVDVKVDVRSEHNGMMFPCYRGIDMSAEYDGMWRIRLVLEDGNSLAFSGWIDFFNFELRDKNDETVFVPGVLFLTKTIL